MKTKKVGLMVCVLAVVLVAGVAEAGLGPIAVPNFSFELDGNGGAITPITGDNYRIKDITANSYCWNERIAGEDAYPLIKATGYGTSVVVPDGDFCLLLKSKVAASEDARVWQILAGEAIEAGNEYLLTFDAATHDAVAGGGNTVIASLIYDDSGTPTSLISETKTTTVSDGAEGLPWDEFTVSFIVPAGESYIGEDIGIQFQNTGEWTCVDNVRLELVPEPATMVLLGLGSLTLLRRRRA